MAGGMNALSRLQAKTLDFTGGVVQVVVVYLTTAAA